ncbi:MAG: outer membrane protein transport protein [Candidatus Cloacimonas sp.]|jgi:long-chain fatty acid transport protein|nr:outer membrane protein transport protein [Candidatus Cloacimonas sp.]
MKKIQLITLILTFVSIGSLLFAGGFALSGVGSRATAMGGAFRGMASDASAMYWNPAGLGFMDSNSVDLGGTFILPSGTWDSAGTQYTQIPGFGSKEYEAEKSLRAFPNLFVTMAKNPKLKYGLGVYVPYGLGTTWDIYKFPTSTAGTGPLTYAAGFPENELKSSIALVDVHPSVAYQIMPNLSAGVGLSVLYGTIELGKISFNPALGATAYLQPISSDMSGSGMGFGANMGLMFKPTPTISVGLSAKIPTTVSMDGEAEIYLWQPQPLVASPVKAGGKSDLTTELNLPADIGIGISLKVKPNWAVNLDYAYTMWNSLEEVVVKMETPANVLGTTESVVAFKWEDTNRVSLGTEYLMGCMALRAGVYYDQTPIPESTQTVTLSDIGDKISSNLGFGRSFGKFNLDANVQYVMFSEREITATEQTATNMAGVFNANSMSANIGLGYRF